MIPRTIHCFWAKGPKTNLAERCLASWRRLAPAWEIREWSLANLPDDVLTSVFCAEAIRLGKWAAVSDWVRMWALKECGGVYLDLDVELVASIDDMSEREWIASEWKVGGGTWMNPGGGVALVKGSELATNMLSLYEQQGYRAEQEMMTVINANLETAMSGLVTPPRVLPPEVMSPIDTFGRLHRTAETVGIHWYAMSWASPQRKLAKWLSWHGMRWVVNGLLRVKRMFVR